jgi:hypothetical protein
MPAISLRSKERPICYNTPDRACPTRNFSSQVSSPNVQRIGDPVEVCALLHGSIRGRGPDRLPKHRRPHPRFAVLPPFRFAGGRVKCALLTPPTGEAVGEVARSAGGGTRSQPRR